MTVVKIKYLGKDPLQKVITTEGTKTLNDKKEIEVSLETAMFMVDNINWSTQEDLKKLFKKQHKEALQEKNEEENKIDQDDNDDEEDEDDDEGVESEDDEENEEDDDDMGDEETAELIKRIPTMSDVDLYDVAEQNGIDVKEYFGKKKKINTDKKLKLVKKIINILKGKEEA